MYWEWGREAERDWGREEGEKNRIIANAWCSLLWSGKLWEKPGRHKEQEKIAKEEIHILYKQVGEKWLCVQETRNEQWENSMVVP